MSFLKPGVILNSRAQTVRFIKVWSTDKFTLSPHIGEGDIFPSCQDTLEGDK